MPVPPPFRSDLDNQRKPWDDTHHQLFHRIGSDTFDPRRRRASGDGYRCGARSPEDFRHSALTDMLANGLIKALQSLTGPIPTFVQTFVDILDKVAGTDIGDLEDRLAKFISQTVEGAMFGRFLRSIPAWVPVERVRTAGQDDHFENAQQREIEHEIEGLLTHSYQMMRAIPYVQWCRWYPWAFHVAPIDGYGYVLGRGNVPTPGEKEKIGDPNFHGTFATEINQTEEGRERIDTNGINHSVACLLDIGGFGKLPGDGARIHPMHHSLWPFWPGGGDYFWACGRWVYDCVHATSMDPKTGRMPTMLHPVKAFAVARYEGFKFQDNEHATPAVRFMFFASRLGGYVDFGATGRDEQPNECAIKFDDKDYTFIVDLPEAMAEEPGWNIGHTPDFPANNLVLRPTLLVEIQMAPYGLPDGTGNPYFRQQMERAEDEEGVIARCDTRFEKGLRPKIVLLDPADRTKPGRRQVRITVPLSQVEDPCTAYGFCVSLGWLDPTGDQAARVSKVVLEWQSLRFFEEFDLHDFDDIRLNLGLNGRFLHCPLDGVSKGRTIPLNGPNARITLYVPDDGSIKMHVHGFDRRGYGDAMEHNPEYRSSPLALDRTLRVGGWLGGILPEELRKAIEKGGEIAVEINGQAQVVNADYLKGATTAFTELVTGDRRIVGWKRHVDQPDHDVASAVAREMFAKILPILNTPNEAVTLLDSASQTSPAARTGLRTSTHFVMREVLAGWNAGSDTRVIDATVECPGISFIGDADGLARNLAGGEHWAANLRLTATFSRQLPG